MLIFQDFIIQTSIWGALPAVFEYQMVSICDSITIINALI